MIYIPDNSRKDRREPWKLSWSVRKKVSKKFKDTEKKIKKLCMAGEWYKAIKLKSLLRRCWWGIKRYK